MRVAVFGGSGFIGSYVVDELNKRGYKVVVADKARPHTDSVDFVEVDITDRSALTKIVENVDAVYNFIAVANLDDAINMPIETMQINVMGNLYLLEACKEAGVSRFIYASSAYALSDEGSFYGISKRTSEKLIEEYSKKYGLEYTIIRYGSLYGDRPSHNNYIYNLIKDALQTGILKYKGDGEDIREYIHAADAAKLSVDILEDNEYRNTYIMLTGLEKLKRIELLIMIKEIIKNRDIKIQNIDNNYVGHYKITPYSFHPTAAKKLVANPFTDLGQGLLEVIQKVSEEIENQMPHLQ